MADSDFGTCSNGLTKIDDGLLAAATCGIPGPPGGGRFVFAARAPSALQGAYGRFKNGEFEAPTAKGASITGALSRRVAGASPFFFVCAGDADVASTAYLLGLSDEATPRLVLAKAALVNGAPAGLVGLGGVLARGVEVRPLSTWVHVKLDVIVNLSGDVIINVFQNDLGSNPVTSPSWLPVPGIGTSTPHFIDDPAQIATGSPSLRSGFVGFGVAFRGVAGACAAWDYLTIDRQF